jgi:hypothetical protein
VLGRRAIVPGRKNEGKGGIGKPALLITVVR